jgi:hypothetical protein
MVVLDNKTIRDYLQHLTGRRPADGKLHLLGIRSAREYDAGPDKVAISIQEPRPNQYDDLISIFGADLAIYAGTVDPGRNWTKYPMRPAGCAHLADGGPYAYSVGLHRGKPAFVQAGPVRLWRDANRNYVQDQGEAAHLETGNGINVHRMGRSGPGVNSWSAGCLGAVWDEWPKFWERAAHLNLQPRYELWLMDGPAFGTWYDKRQGAAEEASEEA